LKKLIEAKAASYLEKLDIHEPEKVRDLYHWTGGLPLFLSRAASLSTEEKAVKVLSDHILEEVEPQFREAFLDMAIPDGFNFEVVRRVLGTGDDEQAKAVLQRLCEASFVEEQGGKLHFLPTVRQVFLRYDELKRPERVAQVHVGLAG
jgi:hypothetical protein